ncbi:MAG: metallophosphoesterase [Candidatus Cryosericum sp.]
MSRYWRSVAGGLAGAAVAAALIDGFAIEPAWLETKRFSLAMPDLPQGFDGFRIAQISDLHLHERTPVCSQIIDAVKAERPHILVITGDLVDRSDRADACAAYVRELCQASFAPVFIIRGNWDHRAFPTRRAMEGWDDALRQAGAHVLVNGSVRLHRRGDSIWLAGTDDPYFGHADLDATFKDVPQSGFAVVLTHAPEDFEELAELPQAQLVLAGHTHGGQVRLPVVGAVRVPSRYGTRFAQGLFSIRDTLFYVNAGVGMSHLPVRFLCRPEFTVLTLVSKVGTTITDNA